MYLNKIVGAILRDRPLVWTIDNISDKIKKYTSTTIKFIFFVFILIFFLSCKKSPDILFCEGLTTDGKGTDCGTVFTTGDLTAVIKRSKGFGSNSITVNVYQKRDSLKTKLESIDMEVKNTDTQANTNLSFYNEGIYQVEAKSGEVIFAEANITIKEE
jgi:hypothetical protein